MIELDTIKEQRITPGEKLNPGDVVVVRYKGHIYDGKVYTIEHKRWGSSQYIGRYTKDRDGNDIPDGQRYTTYLSPGTLCHYEEGAM